MAETRVLIVDDNQGYRQAFRRNLALRGYNVHEAEESMAALAIMEEARPDVVVTDLAMRHPTEGLDLIRQLRAADSNLPIIMISAVGTFDEGAEAIRLGAFQVISKSKIDDEIENLYRAIDAAAAQRAAARSALDRIDAASAQAETDRPKALALLNELLRQPDVPQAAKGIAFDRIMEIGAEEGAAAPPRPEAMVDADAAAIAQAEAALREAIASYDTLDHDTRQTLNTAEFLYRRSQASAPAVDFSRSMGFSYCFAVENETKARLRKKLQKFFADPATPKIIADLLEANGRSVSVFYQQHLLRAQQGMESEATMENFFHTFQRILEHKGRYKPDGLKALGIVLICFGRAHTFKKMNKEVSVDNPLGLKGFDEPQQVIKFASLLINLQHYRNPYIHPEISEMTKLSQIRETAFACLNDIARIQ